MAESFLAGALSSLIFVGIVCGAHGESESCWMGGFTEAFCCDGSPRGNEHCWDAVFTYDRCCGPAACRSSGHACAAGEAQTLTRGAAPYLQERFRPPFRCLSSPLAAAVNDNYCDCTDGSDEPGTAACAGQVAGAALAGFYCRWRQERSDRHQVVRFASVNDGVCDCCNGEDEWDRAHGAAMCPDTCDAVDAAEAVVGVRIVDESETSRGSQERQRYVERARELVLQTPYSDWPAGHAGRDNAFLALAEKGCFEHVIGKDFYSVCPFDRITHRLGEQGYEFVLGRGIGRWHQIFWENGELRNDYSRITLADGLWCFRVSANRSTDIYFECGVEDAIVSVTEPSLCSFEVRFASPAACEIA